MGINWSEGLFQEMRFGLRMNVNDCTRHRRNPLR
jgi:hypothetical protein